MTTAVALDRITEIVNRLPDVRTETLCLPDGRETEFRAIVREDTGEVVGRPVTGRYHPHTLEHIRMLATASVAAFENDPDTEIWGHFRHGHHLWVRPSLQSRLEAFNNDALYPTLYINARYDGRAFRAYLCLYRVVCSNMMAMNCGGISTSIRHFRTLPGKVEELTPKLAKLAANWERLVEHIQKFKNPVTVETFETIYRKLFPEPEGKKARTIDENRRAEMLARFRQEAERVGANAWAAYNAIQGWVQHDSRTRGYSTDYDRMIRGLEDPVLSEAERILLSTAA